MASPATFDSIEQARAAAARAFRSDLGPSECVGPGVRVGAPLSPPTHETVERARVRLRQAYGRILAAETDGQRP